ncbi:MAG: transposase [Limisphaerales bacterium]
MQQNQRPGIEKVADLAMQLSQPYLAEYGARRSRKDFTQRQLMTRLVLRAYLRTTYRGVLDTLAGNASLHTRLGLQEKKLPHFTTLQKFSARSQVAAIAQKIVARVGRAAMAAGPNREPAAMDSTGLDTTGPSAYFESRRGGWHRSYIKLSAIVLCGSLFPLAVVLDRGPSNDRVQVPALLDQAQAIGRPVQLLADAGYDAEWIHVRCREEWGVESLIVPNGQRTDGQRNGRWRALMIPEYMCQRGYGKRWAVESFFSAFKRTMGGALSTRKPATQLAEAAIRVLAYVLRR